MNNLCKYGLSLLLTTSISLAASLTTTQTEYESPNEVLMNVKGQLSGNKDWIGIYKQGSNNDWCNVIAWSWVADKKSNIKIDTIRERTAFKKGETYEARLFFNNSYADKASTQFHLKKSDTAKLLIKNHKPKVGDTVKVEVTAGLSGDKDWIGVYPKNADNSWGNVIAWNWVRTNGIVELSTKRAKKTMPAGEYEARLFFHNSYEDEAKIAFTVGGNKVVSKSNHVKKAKNKPATLSNYANYGTYDVTAPQKPNGEFIYVYKPKKDGVVKTNAPVVLYFKGGFAKDGGRLSSDEEFMKFIASKGYVVIGVNTSLNEYDEFQRIIDTLDELGNVVDKSKIGLIGSSTGGGRIFYQLRRLKESKYASTSFLLSLDGYAALAEKTSNVRKLKTTTLLLQFGGADGLDVYGSDNGRKNGVEERYQDPRILMALYNILPGNEKSFSFLNNHTHNYAAGSMANKKDLRNVVGAMLSYKFEDGGQDARNIVLGNNRYEEIDNQKLSKEKYTYKCSQYAYHYCDVYNPTQDY